MTKNIRPQILKGDISGAQLRAAMHFTDSSANARPFTTGVYVREHKGGVLMTATNGVMLLCAFDKEGRWPYQPAIIAPEKPLHAAMKGARVALEAGTTRLSGRVIARAGDVSSFVKVVADNFPDFDRVLPKSMEFTSRRTDAPWLTFDPAIVSAFDKAARELGARYLHLGHRGSAQPAVVHIADAPAFGVLMGVGTKSEPDAALPAWMGGKAKASATPISDARENAKIAVPLKREMRRKAAAAVDVPERIQKREKSQNVPEQEHRTRTRLSDAERLKRKQERRGFRQRLRAILGRGVRLSHLTSKEAEEAKARAREPLQRMSLAAIAKAAPKVVAPSMKVKSIPPGKPALVFEAKHKADLLSGKKVSTIRKQSPHTGRFYARLAVRVESPKGELIGETTIRKVEIDPTLTPAERKGATRLYGAKAKLVRLTFDRVKAAKPSAKRSRG
jgi:hypothetical protein